MSAPRVVLRLFAASGALAAWYLALFDAIYYPPRWVQFLTGAANETGHVYGFHSGFGGTLLFGAMVLAPIWYYTHTCHYHWSCLNWGRYKAAGGAFGLCRAHFPDAPLPDESHRDWIHRLHREWKGAGRR